MGIEAFDSTAPPPVFDFLTDHFRGRSKEHWRWKYRLGASEEPNAFYWRGDDGTVLGFIGLMRTQLHAPGGPFRAAWFVDWRVVPGERGVGIGVALLRKAEAAAGMLLTLQGSADTHAVLPRLGWRESTRPATWARPLSGRFVAAWLGRRVPPWLAALTAPFAGAALAMSAPRARTGDAAGALEVQRFDSGHDDVWSARSADLAPLMTRDRATLNWFCADFPEGGYRLARLDSNGRAEGHLVTRLDERADGLRCGRIVDVLWHPGREKWLEHAIALASGKLASAGADYVECVSSRPELDGVLARQGFKRRTHVPLWYHRVPAGAPHPDNWMVSLLDCDRAYR